MSTAPVRLEKAEGTRELRAGTQALPVKGVKVPWNSNMVERLMEEI